MRSFLRASVIVVALHLATGECARSAESWPQFRGPEGQGLAASTGLPLKWSQRDNVAWKIDLSGAGFSSPVIQGDELWLTAARDGGHSLFALCVNSTTGKLIRELKVIAVDKPASVHPTNSPASPTPIIDDDRVYVHFGANGTACLTTGGKILWTVKLPHVQAYGPSSTPVLYKDLLIVPCHGTDVRYLVALDKMTGRQRWKIDHKGRCSESTPLVIRAPAGDELIYNAAERVVSIDPVKGTERWSVAQGDNFAQVPRPVFGHGMVYVSGGYFSPVVQAIRPGGKGDVTKTHVAWSLRHSSVPLNPSPVLVGNEFYMVNDKGIASCLDVLTGKVHWRERIPGTYYASPLAAGDRIYFFNEAGATTVIKAGPRFEVLATNNLDERTMASPAVAGNAIYVRTAAHLYRLENAAVAAAPKLPEHVPAAADEPLAPMFSMEKAAQSLDLSALAWQKGQQCSQCHANFMCLIARPAVSPAAAPEVRHFYESLVSDRWEKQGLRYPSEAMVVAVPLALNDAQTTGKLHPLTRKALDRMLTHQRADGGWNGIGGAARTFINEYEETLLAALGIAIAPDHYATSAPAVKALDGIRGYSKSHPPATPYQQGMLLWASRHVSGLMTAAERHAAAESLLALQRADGGWNLRGLLHDSEEWQSGRNASALPSDGYGTGFAIFTARQGGVARDDARLVRGVAWLKSHQRASGRWFTPSLNTYTKQNLPSNSGTAFAIMALRECGEE